MLLTLVKFFCTIFSSSILVEVTDLKIKVEVEGWGSSEIEIEEDRATPWGVYGELGYPVSEWDCECEVNSQPVRSWHRLSPGDVLHITKLPAT